MSKQESFSTRLKNLQDENSTNIYISNLPVEMTEQVCYRNMHVFPARERRGGVLPNPGRVCLLINVMTTFFLFYFIFSNWKNSSYLTRPCPTGFFGIRKMASAVVLGSPGLCRIKKTPYFFFSHFHYWYIVEVFRFERPRDFH